MPRKAQWPPQPRPHPSGQSRVHYEGRDYYLGLHGSEAAKKEYARLLMLWGADREAEEAQPRRTPTVSDAVARWATEELPRHTDQRQEHAYRSAVLIVVRLFGTLPIAGFRAPQLRAVRKAMTSGCWMNPTERAVHARRYATPGWSMGHTNQQIVRIRTVWRWLEGQGISPDGSWSHLRTLPPLTPSGPDSHGVRRTTRRRPACTSEVVTVSRRAAGHAGRMLLLQYWSGMRSGELRRMRVGEIDRSGSVWVYRPGRHKMTYRGHDRAVTLGPRCQAILRPRLEEAGDDPDTLVWPTRLGTTFRANSYAQAVRRAARKAGLPWLTPYSARHGARLRVTRALSLDAARAFMGHASVEMSAQYASGADLQTATEAARKCG